MAISEQKQFPWSLFTLSWSAMNTVFKLVLHEKRSKQTWLLLKNPTFLSRPDFQNELILMLNKDIADIAVQFTQHSKNDLTKGNVFLFYSAFDHWTLQCVFLWGFNVTNSNPLMSIWCTWPAQINVIKQGGTGTTFRLETVKLPCQNTVQTNNNFSYTVQQYTAGLNSIKKYVPYTAVKAA